MTEKKDSKVRLMKTKQERNFNAHHFLLHTALVALENAKNSKKVKKGYQLTVMIMCSLAVEAICNSIGVLIITDWNEWDPTLVKLENICKSLNVDFDKSIEPWSTAFCLQEFRNDIAHAKPELVRKERIITEEMFEQFMHYPESKLERKVTQGNAQRAYDSIKELKNILCLAVPPDKAFGLYSDGAIARTGHI